MFTTGLVLASVLPAIASLVPSSAVAADTSFGAATGARLPLDMGPLTMKPVRPGRRRRGQHRGGQEVRKSTFDHSAPDVTSLAPKRLITVGRLSTGRTPLAGPLGQVPENPCHEVEDNNPDQVESGDNGDSSPEHEGLGRLWRWA